MIVIKMMKRKLNRTITCHLHSLNTKKTWTYEIGNPSSNFHCNKLDINSNHPKNEHSKLHNPFPFIFHYTFNKENKANYETSLKKTRIMNQLLSVDSLIHILSSCIKFDLKFKPKKKMNIKVTQFFFIYFIFHCTVTRKISQ